MSNIAVLLVLLSSDNRNVYSEHALFPPRSMLMLLHFYYIDGESMLLLSGVRRRLLVCRVNIFKREHARSEACYLSAAIIPYASCTVLFYTVRIMWIILLYCSRRQASWIRKPLTRLYAGKKVSNRFQDTLTYRCVLLIQHQYGSGRL